MDSRLFLMSLCVFACKHYQICQTQSYLYFVKLMLVVPYSSINVLINISKIKYLSSLENYFQDHPYLIKLDYSLRKCSY